MKLLRTRSHGIGLLADVDLDLAAIDARVIAVEGDVGQGKTIMLESAICGALYRRCPTRGTLAELVTDARDAFVESTFDLDGRRLVVRQDVDGVTGKGASAITLDGVVICKKGNVKEGDKELAKLVPARELMLASMFGAQGSGQFLDLDPGERKGVILRATGAEGYESLAGLASKAAREAVNEVSHARGSLSVVQQAQPLEAPREERIAELQLELDGVEALLAGAGDVFVRRSAWLAARKRNDRLRAELADKQASLAKNERLLADAGVVRAGAAEYEKASAQLEVLRPQITAMRSKLHLATVERDRLRDAHQEAYRALSQVEIALASMPRVGQLEQEIEAATQRVGQERDKLEMLPNVREQIDMWEALIVELQTQAVDTRDVRIGKLRTTVEHHATYGDLTPEAARATIDEDDERARLAANAPAKLADARHQLGRARAELSALGNPEAAIAAREQSIAQCREQLAKRVELQAKLAPLEIAKADAAEPWMVACEHVDVVQKEIDFAEDDRGVLEALQARNATAWGLAAKLEGIEERIAERQAEVNAAHAAIEDEGPEPVEASTAAFESSRAELLRSIATEQARLERWRRDGERIVELAAKLAAAEAERDDWLLLAESFGRDGLQAFEVETATPTITAVANELLHSCLSDRWTVAIDTVKPSADGEKQLEGCDVRIVDSLRGREGLAKSLSGGERALVGEALALALVALSCERSGLREPTIVRDESGAPLSSEWAAPYVAMLRKAADMVGAGQVLLVSHSEHVRSRCDARIVVADGCATVRA